MSQLKVLISGGGVAGTALAFWLSKIGHDITVIEHFPNLRTTGLQVDLRGQGIEVLRRMGLEQAFRDKSVPEEGIQFVDLKGRNRAWMPANRSGKGPQGITSDFEIMRGDLTRIIYNATGPSAKYIFSTSIASYEDNQNGVEVLFKNGDKETFDLLVGADGAWSATRKMMLGSEAAEKAFHPLCEYNAYMTFRKPIEKGERFIGVWYIATKRRSILVRRHSPDELQLYLLLGREHERFKKVPRGDVDEEKAAFREIFQDAGWKAPELLDAMQESHDFYCERIGVVKMDSWSKDRVVLLGDAASSPGGSGMGTTTAMVGAYCLAGEIGRHCGKEQGKEGLADALKAYEEVFRPFMDQIQSGLENTTFDMFFPSSAWAIQTVHWILTILTYLMIDPIMRLFARESETWKLPDYEELLRADDKRSGGS